MTTPDDAPDEVTLDDPVVEEGTSSGSSGCLFLLAALLIVVSVVCFFAGLSVLDKGLPYRRLLPIGIASLISFGAAVYLFRFAYSRSVTGRIAWALPGRRLNSLTMMTTRFPTFRFVDLYRACNDLVKDIEGATRLHLHDIRSLEAICRSSWFNSNLNSAEIPSMRRFSVGHDVFEPFPNDQFWIVPGKSHSWKYGNAIVRLRLEDRTSIGSVFLEIAAERAMLNQITEIIIRNAHANSIYRNKLIAVEAGGDVQVFDETTTSSELHVQFTSLEPVTREQIILDEPTHRTLKRNVFDFLRKREQLGRLGLSQKRGLLFYGPPGTGKTFTCRYIASSVHGITTIVVAGKSLHLVKEICELARMLQPSILILEDVDLVISEREINPHSAHLGMLLDAMDGFKSDEAILFILTTNAIDRVERAIKDRPGRISQCIHFGLPNETLARQYLEIHLRRFETKDLDWNQLVAYARQTTPAFIKELVHRAVQIAAEDPNRPLEPLRLVDADFQSAFTEITGNEEKATRSIIGFGSS